MNHLLLCSASPRRRTLLSELGLSFNVVAPDVDETTLLGESALELPVRLARAKARAGLTVHAGDAVVALGADTVVVVDGTTLGKPRDRADADRMLTALSGRTHQVVTGICAIGERECTAHVITSVQFRVLSPSVRRWLVDSGESDDKAGAYAAQGRAGAFIERIVGSWSNVVGLPLAETLELLTRAGLALPWTLP